MPRYEFVEGTSSKFWEITRDGTSFTTTYGKLGTSGQSTTKSFKSEAEAQKEYDKIVAEKVKKGYVLVDGGGAAAPAPAAPAPAKKTGKGKAVEAGPAPAPAAAGGGAQRYELVEGTSSKFWEITLEGTSFTTTYGKIGTAGQSTTKSFGDAAAAKKEHDKLVAEKTKKGYVLAGGGGGAPGGGEGGGGGAAHGKAGTAFRMADLELLDGHPHEHAETFMGLKVVPFGGGEDGDDEEGGGGLRDAARRAWRVGSDVDDEPSTDTWLQSLRKLVADPDAGKVKALVVGLYDFEMGAGESAEPVRDALVDARDRLGSLAALFINDVVPEECEVSWLNFCDCAPLLKAYPRLEHLRVRGNAGGKGKLQSAALRSLQLEGSNQGNQVLRQLATADLPNLEHLEVWLGPEDYNGGRKDMADLVPLLSGKLFPKLRHLGLRDSDQADEVAQVVASSPLLERLEVLDLSLGTLGDEGAEALLANPAVARLKTLDIRHHFVSEPVLKKLKALKPVKVKETRAEEREWDDEGQRYVAVGE